MKRLLLATSISLMLLSTAALAQPGHGHGHGHGNAAYDGPGRHDRDDDDRDGPRWHHDNGLHLGQHKFARGERVPVIYLEPRYLVRDYRVYHLAPPPPGYRWVRPADGRYLLIATATGLISQILGY